MKETAKRPKETPMIPPVGCSKNPKKSMSIISIVDSSWWFMKVAFGTILLPIGITSIFTDVKVSLVEKAVNTIPIFYVICLIMAIFIEWLDTKV